MIGFRVSVNVRLAVAVIVSLDGLRLGGCVLFGAHEGHGSEKTTFEGSLVKKHAETSKSTLQAGENDSQNNAMVAKTQKGEEVDSGQRMGHKHRTLCAPNSSEVANRTIPTQAERDEMDTVKLNRNQPNTTVPETHEDILWVPPKLPKKRAGPKPNAARRHVGKKTRKKNRPGDTRKVQGRSR
eukprot:TRINITY_DN24084_c0_g2_i1.p1 TRINITY_DN24084_c0_g2~~TRINITY_DN24084_c0_g2_i1.p1  ORF type:complete len:183 (+),score=34.64 TRINITY_DN24084_c0_g2_i1:37-585(+)